MLTCEFCFLLQNQCLIGPKFEVEEEFHCLNLCILVVKGRNEKHVGVMNLRKGPAVFDGSVLEVVGRCLMRIAGNIIAVRICGVCYGWERARGCELKVKRCLVKVRFLLMKIIDTGWWEVRGRAVQWLVLLRKSVGLGWIGRHRCYFLHGSCTWYARGSWPWEGCVVKRVWAIDKCKNTLKSKVLVVQWRIVCVGDIASSRLISRN